MTTKKSGQNANTLFGILSAHQMMYEFHYGTFPTQVHRSVCERPYVAVPEDPNSAQISEGQAVQMVHKYIQSVPVDRFTRLTPAWKLEETEEGFVVTCHMPHRTPLLGHPVQGPLRSNKRSAKRATALMIVEQLHKLGELDDRLKIKKRTFRIEEVEDDVDAYNRKAGTKKRRRFYLKEELPELRCHPNGPFHLHSIHLRLVEPKSNPRRRLYFPEKDESFLGLVTSTPLPPVGPFHLPGNPSGKMEVKVDYVGEVRLDEVEKRTCFDFHKHLFSHVLSLTDRMEFLEGGPLFVPLLENHQLDHKTLASFNSTSTKLELSQMEKLVVFPTYKPTNDNNRHFFVEGVESLLRVNDAMPNGSETFVAYYKRKYNLDVENMGPLLKVSNASKTPNMLRHGGQKVRTSQKEGRRSFFLPQLMSVEGVGAGLWRQVQMIPSILHRLSSILAAKNLLVRLRCSPLPLHIIKLRSTDSTVGGARAWAVLLAKTSRTAVPTAIMPIIAGGRLYKCLYKMHVDSRAFWGAFWGAFRVFLIDVG